jgi:hypothetical protein
MRSCGVCGSTELHLDEVVGRERLALAQCPRCDHRWTWRPAASPSGAPAPVAAAWPPRAPWEVPDAA